MIKFTGKFRAKLIRKFGQIPHCDTCYSCKHDVEPQTLELIEYCERCILDSICYPGYEETEDD